MDDFTDLDALITEELKLSDARKAAKQGRKLTADQTAALDDARVAAETAHFTDVAAFVVVESLWCACGQNTQTLLGYYLQQEQRRADHLHTRRLIRTTKAHAEKLKYRLYFKNVDVPECAYCACEITTELVQPGQDDLLKAL